MRITIDLNPLEETEYDRLGGEFWLRKLLLRESRRRVLAAEPAEDIVAWIAECCLRGDGKASSTELYQSFRQWCAENGEIVPTTKRFALELEALGFTKYRTSYRRGFAGIQLRPRDPGVPQPSYYVD